MNRTATIRRVIVVDRPIWQGAALTALAVAVPTAARWVIDQGQAGIPFVTFFPTILLVAVFLDWQFGAATAFFSGAVANRLFRSEPLLFWESPRDFLMVALFGLTCAFLIWMGAMLRNVIRELDQAREQEERLNRELLHRARNTLSIVSALASTTARHTPPEGFINAFTGRIAALQRATDLLEEGDQLRDAHLLVERAVAAFRADDNFHIEGPAQEIPQASCVPVVLMLHELCTNAAKHGALSVAGGRVDITWRTADEFQPTLVLHWRERGGPPVAAVRKPGLGTLLLRRQKGVIRVEQRFPAEGVECDIEVERG